jgi:hypothetical protein
MDLCRVTSEAAAFPSVTLFQRTFFLNGYPGSTHTFTKVMIHCMEPNKRLDLVLSLLVPKQNTRTSHLHHEQKIGFQQNR